MLYNFTLRIHKDTFNVPDLSSFNQITISNITIISKYSKFGNICFYKGNQKKFGYSIELSKQFNNVSGSNNYPTLSFKGNYIDIIIKNFPRYPTFTQCKASAKGCLDGYKYTNYINNGYPNWLKYREYEFIIN